MLGEALFEMYGLAKTFSIEKQTMCARRLAPLPAASAKLGVRAARISFASWRRATGRTTRHVRTAHSLNSPHRCRAFAHTLACQTTTRCTRLTS
jgi:hypothetical protein